MTGVGKMENSFFGTYGGIKLPPIVFSSKIKFK
jgi:hypothetical protein